MTLTQQLEDKKKEYRSLKRQHCDDCTKDEECQTCKPEFDNLRKEIAILEQAIAEMQKQRQEILGLIENEIEFENNIMRELEKDSLNETFGYKWHEGRLTMANEILFKVKQLNQPKTEQ